VRILVDAQLPPGLKSMLSGAGHQALHVIDVGLRDASDAMIWDYAVAQGMVILTKDEDFASRRLRTAHGPTILWLRVGNCSRVALEHCLTPLLATIEGFISAGETVIEVR
jgi:predicted nuclease of predicted toxin-antitoxin system